MAGEGDGEAGKLHNHAEICNDTRYEARLVGWEHLAGEAANYDYLKKNSPSSMHVSRVYTLYR